MEISMDSSTTTSNGNNNHKLQVMVWLVVQLVGLIKHAWIQHGLCYFIITVATRKMAQT